MNDIAKENKRIYMREWRLRNKDKIKAAQERYWEKKLNGNKNNKMNN